MKTQLISAFAAAAVAATSVSASIVPVFAQTTLPIKFGKVESFEHESNWFSIDKPGNWKAEDSSKQDEEAIVTFSDPTGNAALVVDVFPYDTETTTDEMGELLLKFINGKFEKFKKYDHGDMKADGDTRVSLGFSYEQTIGKTSFKMYGDSHMELHGGKMMSLITLLIPAEQYDKNKKAAYALIDSFRANPDALANSGVETIGTLADYTNPKKVFSMKVPEDWDVTDNTKSGRVSVIFSNPNGYSFIMVESFKNTKGTLKTDQLMKTLEAYVEDAIGKNVSNYESADAKKEGTNSASKRFTFVITPDKGDAIPMTGIVYLDQVGTTLAYLRVVLPTDALEANKDALDEIGNSFTVSKSAKF